MKTISRKTIRNTSTRPVTSWQNCRMKTLSSHWHRFRRSYHVFTVNFSDRHLNNMEDEIEFLVSAPPLSTWVRNWLFQIKIKTYRRIRNTSTDTKKPYGKDREMDILCCYEKHKTRYISRENRRSKLGKWLWLKKMNKMEHTRILESSKTYIPEKNIKVRALKQRWEGLLRTSGAGSICIWVSLLFYATSSISNTECEAEKTQNLRNPFMIARIKIHDLPRDNGVEP